LRLRRQALLRLLLSREGCLERDHVWPVEPWPRKEKF
jgi:hypothetical protein